MRAVLIGLFIVCSGTCSAQTVLPNVIVDSMIWEIKRGRQCSQVMQAQANEIQALGKENVHLGKALQLSEKKSTILDSLVSNQKESNQIQGLQFQKDLHTEKRKTKRWRRIGIIQGVVIIGIILTTRI